MKIHTLIQSIPLLEVIGDTTQDIDGIENNSQQSRPGTAFVAIVGEKTDGHRFIQQAIDKGAVLIIQEAPITNPVDGICYVRVSDSKSALGLLASALYDRPSEKMTLIGVTGTNGKSTTTSLLHDVLQRSGHTTGLIGTIHHKIGNDTKKSANTTPLGHELQELFAEMIEAGATHAAMEVSSHGLDLKRTAGCDFDVAVFTNLTQDHLDYHHTMDEYCKSKLRLFTGLKPSGTAVINRDDAYSQDFINQTSATVLTYGIRKPADLMASNIQLASSGLSFDVTYRDQTVRFTTQLLGLFNVYNTLAAIGVLLALGEEMAAIQEAIQGVSPVPGRMETIDNAQEKTVIVDFAHTPDALENVLSTVKGIGAGKLICVVGCGGDRDATKRPIMASIAEKYADVAVFTSDNPRTESPQAILEDMLAGVHEREKVRVISDRKEAIHFAIDSAEKGDVVIIAGKGHEPYQIIGTTTYPFNDKEVAGAYLSFAHS